MSTAEPSASPASPLDVAASSDWKPDLYDDRAAFVSRLGTPLVDLLAPRPGERILDLGCGTGDLTAALAARGARVLGIDASPAMIATARARHPGLAFAVENGETLPFQGAFDAIFSNAALHWMLRADEVAAGMARALVPGGRLVAELGGEGNVASVIAAASEVLRARGEDGDRWFRWFFPRAEDYADCLARHGFVVTNAHLFPRPTPLAGEDGLASWLQIFAGPLLTHLGDDAAAFLEETASRCRPRLYRDGVWTLDYVRLRVSAHRGSVAPELR